MTGQFPHLLSLWHTWNNRISDFGEISSISGRHSWIIMMGLCTELVISLLLLQAGGGKQVFSRSYPSSCLASEFPVWNHIWISHQVREAKICGHFESFVKVLPTYCRQNQLVSLLLPNFLLCAKGKHGQSSKQDTRGVITHQCKMRPLTGSSGKKKHEALGSLAPSSEECTHTILAPDRGAPHPGTFIFDPWPLAHLET